VTALDGYLDRLEGVVVSRLNGPTARKGTRWWAETGGPESKRTLVATKAARPLDPGYVVPPKLVNEAAPILRPVLLRIALDSGADTARRLGVDSPDQRDDSMFTIDEVSLANAVDDALKRLMYTVEGHADLIRGTITEADHTSESLDELTGEVRDAHERGGNWVRMSGRALAKALRNEASIKSAEALGVTHMQWVSRRDHRVRPSHVLADGTVRRIDDEFQVGSWQLRFPCDPKDLPASWSEIAGCRCSVKFRKRDQGMVDAVNLLGQQRATRAEPAVRQLLVRAARAPQVPVPVGAPPVPGAATIQLTEPIVGYRKLDQPVAAVPGQLLSWSSGLALGLAAPVAFTAAAPVLAVAIPAGTVVTVAGGSIVLAETAQLEVVGATSEATQARVA
jgi:hypothetical protein